VEVEAAAAAAAAAAFFRSGVPPGLSLEGAAAGAATPVELPPALVFAKNDLVLGEGKTGVGARSKGCASAFFFFFF